MNETKERKNESKQKPKRSWSVAETWLLRIGGIIGAIVAVLTIPSAVHGVWKGWHEGIDRMTEPDWTATANHISIRCVVERPSSEELELHAHCLPMQLGVSSLLSFNNEDFLPRSVRKMSSTLKLMKGDDVDKTYELNRPRFVRYEGRNGVQEVVLSPFTSIDLDANASLTQELVFTASLRDKYAYQEFTEQMFAPNIPAKWTGAEYTLEAVFDDQSTSVLLECKGQFSGGSLKRRRGIDVSSLAAQIQIPMKCN